MAQDLSEKELLRMEVEQLKKEVKNPRDLVSLQSRLLSPSFSLSVGNAEETLGPGLISGLGWDLEDSWGVPFTFLGTEERLRALGSPVCPALSPGCAGQASRQGTRPSARLSLPASSSLTSALPYHFSKIAES